MNLDNIGINSWNIFPHIKSSTFKEEWNIRCLLKPLQNTLQEASWPECPGEEHTHYVTCRYNASLHYLCRDLENYPTSCIPLTWTKTWTWNKHAKCWHSYRQSPRSGDFFYSEKDGWSLKNLFIQRLRQLLCSFKEHFFIDPIWSTCRCSHNVPLGPN